MEPKNNSFDILPLNENRKFNNPFLSFVEVVFVLTVFAGANVFFVGFVVFFDTTILTLLSY